MATFADPNHHSNNVMMASPNNTTSAERYNHHGNPNDSAVGLGPEDGMDIIGGVLMENGGMMSNQRSGSYSNLYPDAELSQQQLQQVMSGGETEGHYSNLPHQLNLVNESGSFGGMRHSIEDVVDATALATAQQHVYSNINGDGEPVMLSGGGMSQELDTAREMNASIGNNGMSWRDNSSSTLMADDMDLDDLSTVATAFQGKAGKTGTRTKKGNGGGGKMKSERIGSESSLSSASSRPLYSDQPEMTSTPLKSSSNSSSSGGGKTNKKHIIPIVAVIETSNNVNNVLNCPRSESSSGTGDLNGSKLQMLHDTTMIDCALDLDSLDTVMDPQAK